MIDLATYPWLASAVGFVVAYVVVAILLLSMNLWTRQAWWVKAAAIVGTGAFFFVAFYAMIGVLGWPAQRDLPERFELLSAMIMEPVPSDDFPGAIYLWANELTEGNRARSVMFNPAAVDTTGTESTAPRAFEIPYTATNQRQVTEAQIRKLEGVRQIGVSNRRPMKPGEHAPQTEFFFHERPDPMLPPKAGGSPAEG